MTHGESWELCPARKIRHFALSSRSVRVCVCRCLSMYYICVIVCLWVCCGHNKAAIKTSIGHTWPPPSLGGFDFQKIFLIAAPGSQTSYFLYKTWWFKFKQLSSLIPDTGPRSFDQITWSRHRVEKTCKKILQIEWPYPLRFPLPSMSGLARCFQRPELTSKVLTRSNDTKHFYICFALLKISGQLAFWKLNQLCHISFGWQCSPARTASHPSSRLNWTKTCRPRYNLSLI